MIVDIHTHCFPDNIAEKAVPQLAENANIPARLNGTVKQLKESMHNSGICVSVIQTIATRPSQTPAINEWAASVQDESIKVFGTIHPEYNDWKKELVKIKNAGLKGLKFHPYYQNFYINDERMFPVYEAALKLDLILLFHAGVDIGLAPPYHVTPDRLKKVLETFPGIKIIAAHMGGFKYWDRVEKHLCGLNIYLDTSYCLDYIEKAQLMRIIKNHGYKKILFGSDSPWKDQKEEIAKIRALDLESYKVQSILGFNAVELLKLRTNYN